MSVNLKAPAGQVPVPNDPAIPQLGDLLHGDRVATALQREFPGTRIQARAKYIRYKPGNKAIVLFEGSLDGTPVTFVGTVAAFRDLRRLSRRGSSVEVAARARSRCLATEPVFFLAELNLLIEWYPANLALPGLAFDTLEMREALEALGRKPGLEAEPRLLVYKPERRAVLKWGDSYVRIYARTEDYATALKNGAVSGNFPIVGTPRLLRRMDAHRVLVQSEVPGRPFDAVHGMERLGTAVSRIHATDCRGLKLFSPEAHLELARRTEAHLERLLPSCSPRARRLVADLESRSPKQVEPVPSHGDLHAGQVLETRVGLAILDFDHMALADPSDDLATFAAHTVQGEPGDGARAKETLARLTDGYGSRPRHLDWYLSGAILRRAGYPFRWIDPEWPARIEGFLTAADEALHEGRRRVPAREDVR